MATYLSIFLFAISSLTIAQDVGQCALNCIANVSGTSCAQAQWSCLCKDRAYIERVNNCTVAACDKADEDITFGAIAQICAINGQTIGYGPEATASTQSDQIFSTQGLLNVTSLPPVSTSTMTDFPSGTDGYTIATAPPSPTSELASGTASPSITPSARSSTSEAGSAAAAATSTAIADKIDSRLALGFIFGVHVLML